MDHGDAEFVCHGRHSTPRGLRAQFLVYGVDVNAAQTTILAGVACVALVALFAPRNEDEEDLEEDEGLRPVAPLDALRDRQVIHGVVLTPEELLLEDWSAWMGIAPEMLRVTLCEGERDPEIIVANLFRRLFPGHPWPPTEDSPLMPAWNRTVALVGRSLERPFRPHFEIVS